MQRLWKKIAAVGFLVFLCLWVGGMVRSWAQPLPSSPREWRLLSSDESVSRQAVANNLQQIGLGHAPLPVMLEQANADRIQVYDKRANLAASTSAFDDDEGLVRSALTAHHANIFNEISSGIAPERRLSLEIGVSSEQFDALVERLRQIGHLESLSVHQQDRTGEFRRLHAQQQSLKKYLESVLKLRGGKASSVDEELKLEQRIQEIEKELQGLAVQLGELLGKESFYHVRMTLSEFQPGSRADFARILPHRLADASLWALAWWGAAALAVGVLAATYLSVRTLWSKPSASVAPRSGEGTVP
jgi:Domain of unknown function (DUF4349)